MDGVKPATAKEVSAAIANASLEDIESICDRYKEDPRKQVQNAVKSALRRLDKERSERARVQGMYDLQNELAGSGVVVGVDEVGRGSIAGPLTVCALALPYDPIVWGINDSKQLTAAKREALSEQILDVALAVGICHISPEQIDKIGMGRAIKMAMAGAIENTGIDPDAVIIDGNPVHAHPNEITVVKGDAKIASIAAASIVAKVTRDAMMIEADELYPEYHFASCKGYASAEHIEAIGEYGLCELHRASFCGNFLKTPRLF